MRAESFIQKHNIAIALIKLPILLALFSLFASCSSNDSSRDPIQNFDTLWQQVSENYALFEFKQIDWDSLYRQYRPQITANTSDQELFGILEEMLEHLRDPHLHLRKSQHITDLGAHVFLKEQYIANVQFNEEINSKNKSGLISLAGGLLKYGWLENSIAYLRIEKFENIKQIEPAIDSAIAHLRTAYGMIIDVRASSGKEDKVVQSIGNRFTEKRIKYMYSKTRSHDRKRRTYEPHLEWYVRPQGPHQFIKPVVLLTNNRTSDAAENFALLVRALPHGAVAGENTAGKFGSIRIKKLPNSWALHIPTKIVYDANDVCWQGGGVAPDLFKHNNEEDHRDSILESALALLERLRKANI